MKDKNKKRDPMPPPDATPEEIGEFWDTHSLADYWDETHEVEFQVNQKLSKSAEANQNDSFSAEQGWQKLKELIQNMGDDGIDFEELVAKLLGVLLETHFELEKSGYQPRGDAINEEGTIVLQTKKYRDKNSINRKEIVGDILEAHSDPELPNLQSYVLAASRTMSALLLNRLNKVAEETGLDIITLELTNNLSNLGALCVTFWRDIRHFFDFSNTYQRQKFSDWAKGERTKPKTIEKIEELKNRLKQCQQSRNQVQKDTEVYLLKRFSGNLDKDRRFNYPIDLSQATERKSLEAEISHWWATDAAHVCYLEGEEGMGKSWLSAKCVNSICSDKHIVTFWLDSNRWNGCKSLDELLQICLETLPNYQDKKKVSILKRKIRNIWWPPTLIILDGVNEGMAIEAAKSILQEYFTNRDELENRIRFLLTTRPVDAYRNFEYNLWDACNRVSVGTFNDTELKEALSKEGLQPDSLPNSLKKIAKIPRYFKTCIRLRELFDSFDNVTKEMVLWADLLYKIKHTDPQVRKKFDWQDIEEAQEDLAKLALEAKWTNVDDAPQASLQLLIDCFPNYRDIRRDLEEQRIALKAHKRQAKLSEDHVLLGWAIHLSNLFDSMEFNDTEDLFERFQQKLEPIPSEDLRTKALFVALQITAISPDPNTSQDQLSRKRAALMLAWFHSHNAKITDKQLSFWGKEDTDAYAQVVEFKFRHRNSSNDEDALIEPLAKTWLNEEEKVDEKQIARLAVRLKKWLLPTYADSTLEDHTYVHVTGQPLPREKVDVQVHLLDAALSILSQRSDIQFLRILARCYAILRNNANSEKDNKIRIQSSRFYEKIGRLMRWGYTETKEVLDELCSLVEQFKSDALLLEGAYRLAEGLRVDLPTPLQRPLSEKEKKMYARVEKHNRRFKPDIDRIRNQERLLIGNSPAAHGNYRQLDDLAVRTDLPDLHHEDIAGIKKILKDVSANVELGQTRASTLEDSCIKNLLPWVAKYDIESYAELACSLKLNALNQKWARLPLSSIQGIMFKPEDRKKMTEAILGMKQRLVQDIKVDNSSSEVISLTSSLTEILLFSASGEQLTDWFEFLASHEALRESIFTPTQQVLFNELLPKSIVKLVQQKLKTSLGNQFSSDIELEKITEKDFWSWLYLCISDNDEDTVTWAFENLKRRESDLRTMTFCFLEIATSDSNRFLSEIFADKKVRRHLFLTDGRFFSTPIYEGDNSYSHEDLMSVLPQEVVGSFLCSPKRRADLSRWGKALMGRMCSMLQSDEINRNSAEELRFTVNREVLKIWAEQDPKGFSQLANEYFNLLSESGWYCPGLYDFMDNILCLLLRFQPTTAMRYYRQSKAKGGRIIFWAYGGVESLFAQLWRVEDCNLPEHRTLRRKRLEGCLNDEEIMFMTLAALAGGGEEELWNLVIEEYLKSPYAKERNLGVSILPWFGNDKAVEELKQLKSEDTSLWVREHAAWAYEVAQQERSCREVYREALQTRDLFRISAVFEQIKPALLPTARWWHEIEHKEFREESQNINSRLAALVDRFWYRWENSMQTKSNLEVFGRRLREHCRGEKISAFAPRIAPWWKPSSD